MNLFISIVLSVVMFLSYSKMIYNFIKIVYSANTQEEREKHLKTLEVASIVATIIYLISIPYLLIYSSATLM